MQEEEKDMDQNSKPDIQNPEAPLKPIESSAIEDPDDVIAKWQQLVDLTAEIFDVPAALLMRVDLPDIEVFRSSQNPENPYEAGDKEKIAGLYCEEVITEQEMLHVPNAQDSEQWRDNPDVEEFGLISYLGFPVSWPDGDPFGTICVLDKEEREYSSQYKEILQQFSRMVESDLETFQYTEELELQRESLQRKSEQLEEFASVVSHDLRNPLNVAQGRIELAREEYSSDNLDEAAGAIERSLTLIEDMLALAKAGQQTRDLEPVDISNFVHTCWEHVETREATIQTDLDLKVRADKSRVQQLFENLFRNAVEQGGETVTIRVGPLPDGFYVEDDGPGIPEGEREDVWEAGYSGIEEGTGFGLSIVQQIVEAHDWEIRITESTDGGARFEITGVHFDDE
jgi:signal transduction histidine kinase